MRNVRALARPVSLFLAILMSVIFCPYQTVMAKMITAQTVLDTGRASAARAYIDTVMAREDMARALVSQGIDVREAKARIDALSNAEVVALADHMQHLPAGGSDFAVIVGASLVVFIVLLVTDILGYTDIFPFVKKAHR
jgi:Family of unknown function (DUF6627)